MEDSKDQYMLLRKHWYNNPTILFQIIQNLKYKETVFIRPGCCHRNIKSNAMHYLEKNFTRYHFFDEDFNLYYSLSHYPNLPMFSFSRLEKQKEMREFNKECINYIEAYDFFIDIDNKDLTKAYKSLKKILPHFRNTPYSVHISGQKGFHIFVSYNDFPESFKKMKIVDLITLFKNFGRNFAMINGFDDIDFSIYDPRRVMKCPYSVVFVDGIPKRVALPMSDNMIEEFKIEEYEIKYCLANLSRWRNRGLLKRPGDPEKFGKLIKKYGELE